MAKIYFKGNQVHTAGCFEMTESAKLAVVTANLKS